AAASQLAARPGRCRACRPQRPGLPLPDRAPALRDLSLRFRPGGHRSEFLECALVIPGRREAAIPESMNTGRADLLVPCSWPPGSLASLGPRGDDRFVVERVFASAISRGRSRPSTSELSGEAAIGKGK